MAKVNVVVTHEEIGTIDLGDIPERLMADILYGNDGWSLSDLAGMGADWKRTKVTIDGKEFDPPRD